MSTLLVDLASGFAAGINVTLVGHPFDTVKVRLQTQPMANPIYTGFIDCVKKTIAWEGPTGLYKGVGAPLAGQVFFRSAMFWCNATYLRWATSRAAAAGGRLSYLDYALGGSLTWAVCTTLEAPLNVASSQLQVQIVRQKSNPAYKPEFPTLLSYVRNAPGKYGLRALYAGVVPHLLRNSAGGFFHFGAFEASRREYAARKGVAVSDIGLGANLAAGSLGGFLFWALTYPLDVVKSALQGDNLAPDQRRYSGTLDAFRKLWAEGGAARFTRGFSACILRSVPANAVLLTTAFRVKEVGYAWVAKSEGK